MIKHFGAFVLAAGTISLAGGLPAVADGSASATYVVVPGGDAGGFVNCQGPQSAGTQGSGLPKPVPNINVPLPVSAPVGLGGACFYTQGTPSMTIDIKDQSGQLTPGVFYFQDADGNQLGGITNFCGHAADAPVPAGSDHVAISVGMIEPNLANLGALSCATPEPVTTGTITVTGAGVKSLDSALTMRPVFSSVAASAVTPARTSAGVSQTAVAQAHAPVRTHRAREL